MSQHAWTVAVDDGLTQRFQACTTCGKRPVVSWGLCGVAALAVKPRQRLVYVYASLSRLDF